MIATWRSDLPLPAPGESMADILAPLTPDSADTPEHLFDSCPGNPAGACQDRRCCPRWCESVGPGGSEGSTAQNRSYGFGGTE
jgi:hypothetical protein